MKKLSDSELSAVWQRGSGREVAPVALEKEQDRWLALLLGKSEHELLAAPLRYGPLTVEGYFTARQNSVLVNAEGWPRTPGEIARILTVCGLDQENATSAVIRQFKSNTSDANQEVALRTLIGIGRNLEVDFTVDDAISVLSAIGLRREITCAQFDALLGTANAFIATAIDEDRFFTGWASHVKIASRQYGGESICTVAVWHLARADANAMQVWCTDKQDYQALALMVHQGRLSFSGWLRIVAESRAIPVVARSARISESGVHRNMQFHEQYQTVRHLANRIPGEDLAAGAQDLAMTYPHLVDELLRMAPAPDKRFDAWLGWALPFVQMGLCTADHPLFVAQLNVARNVVEQAIDTEGKDIIHIGMSAIGKDEMVDVDWVRLVAPRLAEISPAIRDLLAQRMILGLSEKNVDDVLDAMGAVHATWFSDADIGAALRMRGFSKDNKKDALKHYVNMVLMPWLNKRHWPVIGAQLALACDAGQLPAKTVRGKWKSYLPNVFGKTIPAEFQDSALLLYAMTRSDPRSLRGTLDALGCARGSAGYQHCIEGWIADKLNVSSSAEPLPSFNQ
jgi:hypothetical protein